MSDTLGSILFEGFRLDAGGLFRVNGSGPAEPVPLGSRALDLLLLLAQRQGEVVAKEAIMQIVWRGTAVEESNLTVQISALRRLLDGDRKQLSCIQTIPGRGYRFVASIRRSSGEPIAPVLPSIAVLPFQNMSGDPEQEYFVDGIVEEITTAISRLPSLLVISRSSTFAYKGKAIDVRQVAHEFGVRYVLEGSVRRSGNHVRITGQLIDTSTAAHIWADRFDGALEDIFELQDRVASSVAGAIEPKLRLAEIGRAYRKPTESLDAYDLYLRAVAEGWKRTKESFEASVRFARRALELDPGYAPAMARLAHVLSMQRVRHWISASAPEVAEGIRLARQALAAAADDQWALTFAGVALANLNLAQDFDAGLAALDRAIALNPNFAYAIAQRALVLSYRRDHADEAVRSAEQVLNLSPFDPVGTYAAWMALACAHLAAGRYEAGLPWAVKARRANGGLPAFKLELSLCGHLGRHTEAGECLRELREIMPDPTIARLNGLHVSPEVVAHLIEGWRKAGVPED